MKLSKDGSGTERFYADLAGVYANINFIRGRVPYEIPADADQRIWEALDGCTDREKKIMHIFYREPYRVGLANYTAVVLGLSEARIREIIHTVLARIARGNNIKNLLCLED